MWYSNDQVLSATVFSLSQVQQLDTKDDKVTSEGQSEVAKEETKEAPPASDKKVTKLSVLLLLVSKDRRPSFINEARLCDNRSCILHMIQYFMGRITPV